MSIEQTIMAMINPPTTRLKPIMQKRKSPLHRDELGLNAHQRALYDHVCNNQNQSAAQIAKHTGIRKTTIQRSLVKLMQNGLLQRTKKQMVVERKFRQKTKQFAYNQKNGNAPVAGLMITCRDIDDAEYWKGRLNALNESECKYLLFLMLDHRNRMQCKGMNISMANDRMIEGEKIYAARFGIEFLPF